MLPCRIHTLRYVELNVHYFLPLYFIVTCVGQPSALYSRQSLVVNFRIFGDLLPTLGLASALDYRENTLLLAC
jgi:hypothetical protein